MRKKDLNVDFLICLCSPFRQTFEVDEPFHNTPQRPIRIEESPENFLNYDRSHLPSADLFETKERARTSLGTSRINGYKSLIGDDGTWRISNADLFPALASVDALLSDTVDTTYLSLVNG